jgi:hypothetical protein
LFFSFCFTEGLCGQDANTTDFLNLPLSTRAEELGLDDDGDLREVTGSKDLVVSLIILYLRI